MKYVLSEIHIYLGIQSVKDTKAITISIIDALKTFKCDIRTSFSLHFKHVRSTRSILNSLAAIVAA